MRDEAVKHRLHIFYQAVISHQVGDNVSDGSTQISEDQINDLCGGRGKAEDAQAMIDKDRGDTGPGQKIIHIVVGP